MNFLNRDTDRIALATADPAGPDDAEGFNLRGTVRVSRGNLRDALDDFGVATRLRPEYPEAWNNRGLVRQWLEGPTSGLADFHRALALRPDYAEALNNRARSLQARGDVAGALADFNRALECSSGRLSASIYHNRGALRQETGDLPGARADYDLAIGAEPFHAATYVNRGDVRKDQNDLAGALADFDRALELLPPEASAPAYHGRGGVRVLLNDFVGAIADYDEAIRIDPDYCVAYLSRGSACYHRRDARGLADYLMAFSMNPEAAARELVRVLTEGLRLGVDEILANADQHLRINPRDVLALARRGLTLVILGREEEAAPHLKLFLDRAPGCAPYWDLILRHARIDNRSLAGSGSTIPPFLPEPTPAAPPLASLPTRPDPAPERLLVKVDLVDRLFAHGPLDLGR